ncbi:hypothetical protein JCM15548_11590 [Geofilum rubicundum JCM 15548]|uniref:Uncharacterized protein n=1 Tax=Geofilum rubicundum JCM 15548 TaxID=1236989 RepID=A0A0E9LVT7_9BACT|nr:hypothetical protein JCM15548_11590 [Geofilum rubicundum JCM 15548]
MMARFSFKGLLVNEWHYFNWSSFGYGMIATYTSRLALQMYSLSALFKNNIKKKFFIYIRSNLMAESLKHILD